MSPHVANCSPKYSKEYFANARPPQSPVDRQVTSPQLIEMHGIHGETHKWISNFLVGRNQSVVVDGSRSEERQVKSGVPQGTVLGPLLFLLHINDITATIDPQTKCRLFADDCLL